MPINANRHRRGGSCTRPVNINVGGHAAGIRATARVAPTVTVRKSEI